MNAIALCIGSTVIYWGSLVIALGLLAALLMTLYLQRAVGGRSAPGLLFMILLLLFSVPLCRALHWYCHIEQYASFRAAMTDFDSGSYVLSGALRNRIVVYGDVTLFQGLLILNGVGDLRFGRSESL